MAYSLRADVESRLAGLPDDGENEKIDNRIEDGIEYADSIIDGKLAACYKVPFTAAPNSPKLIKNISADLAAAFALTGGFSAGGEDESPALSVELRKRAMDLLHMLVEKEMLLPQSEAPPPDETDVGVIPNHSCLGQRPSLQDFDLYNPPAV